MSALIFDFDGTIADSFETLLGIFEEVTARPRKLTSQEIKNLRGKPLKEVVRYLKIKRWQIPRLIISAKRLVAVRMAGISAFPDMPQTLKQLHQDGHQMFILSTNDTVSIREFLKKNGMDGYFSRVYGDIGLLGKSSALKKVISKENLRSSQCFYVGDEVRDIEAAKKRRIKSIAVSWGFNYPEVLRQARPDGIAKNPRDIVKIVNKLSNS